jgi:hypothetical protein
MGGADGARAALDAYWRRVSRAAAFSPLQRSPLERMMGRWTLDTSPAYLAMDLMSRVFSPYDLNPTGFNPLRKALTESIDFERLVASPIKLFITARMCIPAADESFATAKSRPTCRWPRHASHHAPLSRSTASHWDGGLLESDYHAPRATRIPSWSRQSARAAETPRTAAIS